MTDIKLTNKLIQSAVEGDDMLQRHAKNLARLAMTEATQILMYGTPQAKATMVSKFVPAIVRAIESETQDDDMVAMRTEYLAMMKEMGSPIFGEDDDE